MAQMSIGDVNAMDLDEFVEFFGNIIEHCPVLSAALWYHRPFRSPARFMEAMDDIVDRLPVEGENNIPANQNSTRINVTLLVIVKMLKYSKAL